MKVLVIGSDPNIFLRDSGSFRRMREYAAFFDAFHIVSRAPDGAEKTADGNLFLWPVTGSMPLAWLKVFLRARAIARAQNPDMIDAQDAGEWGLAAYLVGCMCAVPVRVQIHTDIMSPHYRRASPKEYARWMLARFLIPRVSCVRAVSERVRRSLQESGRVDAKSNTVVLPIYTDISKFLAALPDPATEKRLAGYGFKMVASGRFVDKEKNFTMLIDLMPAILARYPRTLLVLAGDGPDRATYESRIMKRGLEKHVIIEPWRDDLASFYKSFDVFLLSSRYEGWGRAAIEAMAAELPVVMTDVGLAGEAVKNRENGMVVSVGDRQGFLSAVLEMIRDPDLRRHLARAGRESAQKLGPDSSQAYCQAYADALFSCREKAKK